jgi:hypothetical protein
MLKLKSQIKRVRDVADRLEAFTAPGRTLNRKIITEECEFLTQVAYAIRVLVTEATETPAHAYCPDCANGTHEVSGNPACACVCHGNGEAAK